MAKSDSERPRGLRYGGRQPAPHNPPPHPNLKKNAAPPPGRALSRRVLRRPSIMRGSSSSPAAINALSRICGPPDRSSVPRGGGGVTTTSRGANPPPPIPGRGCALAEEGSGARRPPCGSLPATAIPAPGKDTEGPGGHLLAHEAGAGDVLRGGGAGEPVEALHQAVLGVELQHLGRHHHVRPAARGGGESMTRGPRKRDVPTSWGSVLG